VSGEEPPVPEVLKSFAFATRIPKPPKFESLLDGQIWKVSPDEFDYDSPKALIGAIKAEALKKFGRYVQTGQTLDGHVVVQARAKDYVPQPRARRKPLSEKGAGA
jgi:hypothetical protein